MRAKLAAFAARYPNIIRKFRNGDAEQRAGVLRSLYFLDDDRGLALPLVIAALRDPNADMQAAGMEAVLCYDIDPIRPRRQYICEGTLDLMTDIVLRPIAYMPMGENYAEYETRARAGAVLRRYATPYHLARLMSAYMQDKGRTLDRDTIIMRIFTGSDEPRLIPTLVAMLDRTKVYWKGQSVNLSDPITAAPADTALFALIELTGEKLDDYDFYVGEMNAEPVTMPVFKDDADRRRSITKFRKWWEEHKARYKELTPLRPESEQ